MLLSRIFAQLAFAVTFASAFDLPTIISFLGSATQGIITRVEIAYPPLGNYATIDLEKPYLINGLGYIPAQNALQQRISTYSVAISLDNSTWTTVVADGSYENDPSTKYVGWTAAKAQYVRITAKTSSGALFPWSSDGSFNVLQAPTDTSLGQWSPMIAFPLTISGAFVIPDGKIVTFSSYRDNEYNNFPDYKVTQTYNTRTATYDPATGDITDANILGTEHDMFCPGMSMDHDGNTVVTGGDSSKATTTYDIGSHSWTPEAEMTLGRGYQSSATTSTGHIFTIGGSWSGGQGNKNGEIYDISANKWTSLSGCPVAPMLTADSQGIYRQDNHAWLFGWKNGSVFQAGPSKAMNWYGTLGSGSQSAAGPRGSSADAMTGNAVLYDAVAGKIFVAGGSPDYQNSTATKAAYLITISDPNTVAKVSSITSMSFARAFHNSVVLPNGKVFVTGGQSYAVPFTDSDSIMNPELWDPDTQSFTTLTAQTVPRNYHSVALLMQDGRVFTGGAGLCGQCSTNHADAQIYSPAYLFTSSGAAATRPVITSLSSSSVPVGGTFTIKTDSVTSSFSLVRYGSATHTVNTDQRRIPLTPVSTSGTSYTFKVPSDPGVALPGYWMMFALNAQGVPSVSKNVLITL